MGRRIETPEPSRAEQEALAWRYRNLARLLMASEPSSPAAALSARITAERDRLDRAGAPLPDRLAALEDFIAELRLSKYAERHLAHLRRATEASWWPSGAAAPAPSPPFEPMRRGSGAARRKPIPKEGVA
jgi:hypothetical protein